jgi:hypothetical protein
LLRVTGPFTVEFQGQQRQITADNVYSEIERQRILSVEKPEDLLVHKEMLGLIGKNLVERLKAADRKSLLVAMQQFASACDVRDLQVYVADPVVEAELERQHCAGQLLPVADQPMLAVTYANMALAKTSLDMRPKMTLRIGPRTGGQRHVQLDLDLRDGAVPDEDPFLAGFQRWWVTVLLPEGSQLLSDRGPMEDPEAPNGGSYVADLWPDMTGSITVRFTMPDGPSLLIRRQPGVRPGDVVISAEGCGGKFSAESDRDLLVDLNSLCV